MTYGIWTHLQDEEHVWRDPHGGQRNEAEEVILAAIDAKRTLAEEGEATEGHACN